MKQVLLLIIILFLDIGNIFCLGLLTIEDLQAKHNFRINEIQNCHEVYSIRIDGFDTSYQYEDIEYLFSHRDSLVNLQKIQITNCSVDSFDFSVFKSLQILILNITNLDRLPESIGELVHLKIINLSGNRIKSFPTEILILKSLEEIIFGSFTYGYNQIAFIPPEIQNLDSLRKLVFLGNSLSKLPDEIGNLINLKELYLGANEIETLPESIGNLKQLEILSLESNKIKILPDRLRFLTNLKVLRLRDNKDMDLTSCFEVLIQMKDLKVLDLSNNNIIELPDELRYLICEELFLDQNENLDSKNLFEQLSGNPCITKLNLKDCNIIDLPVPDNPLKIKYLNLANNDIQFNKNSFSGLQSVESLDLSSVKNIDLTHVSELKNLKELTLEWCELQTIPEEITLFTNLEKLDISRNEGIDLKSSIGLLKSLQNLTELDISFNYIDYDESRLFPEITELNRLKVLISKYNYGIQPAFYAEILSEMNTLNIIITDFSPENLDKNELIELFKRIQFSYSY